MSPLNQVSVPRLAPRDSAPPPQGDPNDPAALAAYRTAVIRVGDGCDAVELVPRATQHAPDPAAVEIEQSPVSPPLRVIPASTPWGELLSTRATIHALNALQRDLDDAGIAWVPAAIYAPGREWVERAVAVTGLASADVAQVAARHGQPLVLHWRRRTVAVQPTPLGVGVVPPMRIAVTLRRAAHGCPMRFDDPTQRCIREGGPFTSSSMRAALIWEHHRRMLVTTSGCTVCEGGAVTANGRPYGLYEMREPTRWASWTRGEMLDDPDDPDDPQAPLDDDDGTPGAH